jgi:dipeptidyl aminopeptidase/acylaminoacyl peptidase
VAFDDGNDVKVMNGANGKKVKPLAASTDTEDEPSWQPHGTLLAYRRGPAGDPTSGSIWIANTKRPAASTRRLTTGADDRRPVFSADGKVLAFVRGTPRGDHDLCLLPIAAPAQVSCLMDANVNVDRPTWSPDGKAILTIATDPADPGQWELFLYTTAKPFSARAGRWSPKGIVTDGMHGKRQSDVVLYASWAPDGTQVAFTANWGSPNPSFYSAFLAPATPAGLGEALPFKPKLQACEVAWRPDSKELALMQADDCGGAIGAVVRVDPTKPSVQIPLRNVDAGNPAWQPIDLTTTP